MPKFIINGRRPLGGELSVKGAKNFALKIIPATILSKEPIQISNLPEIEDVTKSLDLLKDLGATIERQGDEATIGTAGLNSHTLLPEIANKFRASIMFVAPLLSRFGEVKFAHPGGCVIGAGGRAIDLFLDGFSALGAEITHDGAFYHIRSSRLKGSEYFFTIVSVTGTEAMIMAATLAEGVTTLRNCAMEPEIKALADYLNSVGARIEGAGTPTIRIEGVKELKGGKCRVIPDRIETGTFAVMAAASGAELTINDCAPEHIAVLLSIFRKIGISFGIGQDFIKVHRNASFRSYGIKTHEYPGFPTDLQSPYTVLMTQASGSCIIHETIYDRRLLYVDMLSQMGADIIICDPHRVVVNGPSPLKGKKLTSPDLRAGIAMIIAGLIAEGTTEIDNIYQIDRGYENIDQRLCSIGADIKRI